MIAAIFDFDSSLEGTAAGKQFFLACVAGLVCQCVHCLLVYGWVTRKPGDPGTGGVWVVAAFVLVWLAGSVIALSLLR